ncbi:MAG: DUF2235 domain-containing protein, partial [Telluria sp.]|nr:DUF2235 domain-containing protein [Telluria sp.]
QPVAVIDTPDAGAAHGEGDTALARFTAGIATIWHAWFGKGETIAYLQNNHIGATEMATDAKGKPIWQATYSPFGKFVPALTQAKSATGALGFELNLRLPGQYADAETGLYYNDHRYYDPARGRYMTPDPLGLRAGANSYAYVNGNPLKYIDPSGLVLFAFDGTGNSVAPPASSSISNVRKFYEAYDQKVNGLAYYITGIGTTDENMPVKGNTWTGDGFDARVALAFTFLDTFVDANLDQKGQPVVAIDIDVVGFSRGAAEARVWMNQLVRKLVDGRYTTARKNSRCINLRFEGLWDTVSHLVGLKNDEDYNFAIPSQIKYVAQAVALNEHRSGPANFDGRSIFDAPPNSSVPNRAELGFLGSHSDIGGGYGTGDLSDAALMWIIQQGKSQGIKFIDRTIADASWNKVTNPILHDLSGNATGIGGPPSHLPLSTDRKFMYGDGKSVNQAAAIVGGNTTTSARTFVSYYLSTCGSGDNWAVGQVDMTKYSAWLRAQGVNMGYTTLSPKPLCK